MQFKRGSRSFTLNQRAGISVSERDFVVVEADRGEDIGVVVEIMGVQTCMERRMQMGARGRDAQQGQGQQHRDKVAGGMAASHPVPVLELQDGGGPAIDQGRLQFADRAAADDGARA